MKFALGRFVSFVGPSHSVGLKYSTHTTKYLTVNNVFILKLLFH